MKLLLTCINPLRLAHVFMLALGGGGGSSSSSQSQTTQNSDMRVVGGDSSTNISSQNSTINVTDAGAVHQAFGFASQVVQGAFDNQVANQQSTQQIVSQSEQAVADAYSTAKAGEQKVLVAAVFGIIGVVAFAAVKK